MRLSLLRNLRHSVIAWAALAAGMMLTSCGMVTDEPVACPALLRVRFVYDNNIKFADAFAHEVKSVCVWAFDSEGKLVWSDSRAVPASEEAAGSFYIDTPLTEGKYDFVSWCGLEGNESFELATYTPASKEELKVKLLTLSENGETVSKDRLPGLFHGYVSEVDYKVDPFAPSYKTVTIPLMKDTKDIRIMLQHLDGSEIDNRDFSCTITTEDANLDWNNALLPSPMVTYRPWDIRYGQTTAPGERDTKAVTTVASLLFDMSTSRLSTERKATLTVHRNWDDRDIIKINLIDYLLLVKGHYDGITSDQDYLDRQDDYSIVFFIDQNSNWYMAGGIFVNSWAVVPPQDMEM